MLVLERTLDSAIRIGGDIRIKVLAIPGKRRVRLGLEVPGGTLIWREELGAPPQAKLKGVTEPGSKINISPDDDPLSVMIVEDDAAHARLIQQGFQRAGKFKCFAADAGEKALAMLQDPATTGGAPPHLCILDLNLPGISGLETLKQIRAVEAFRQLPVVMLSGVARDEDVSQCLDAGANAFLAKTDNYAEFCELAVRIAEFWRLNKLFRPNGNGSDAAADEPAGPSKGQDGDEAWLDDQDHSSN